MLQRLLASLRPDTKTVGGRIGAPSLWQRIRAAIRKAIGTMTAGG